MDRAVSTAGPGLKILAATVAMLASATAVQAEDQDAEKSAEVLVIGQTLPLPKYSGPVLTTPQSATVVTSQLMQEQGVDSLRDALRNVSGISIGAGEGSYQGDNFSIRGFAGRSDMYLDGMSDWGNYSRDSFNTAEVEVLKGASSVEFGRGAGGGVVNTESKTPMLQSLASLAAQTGTNATRRLTIDLDTPISGISGTAVRVNAMVDKENTTDRPGVFISHWGLAPSVAFGLDSPTRIVLSYLIQHQNDLPDYGIPWINDRPAPVARTANYAFTDGGNYFDTTVQMGTLKVEHDFNDQVTLREQFRLTSNHRRLDISQGDPAEPDYPLSALPTLVVDRTQIDADSADRSIDDSLDLIAHFQTGGLDHSVDLGAEFLRQAVDPRRVEPCWVGVTPTPLLNPQPYDPFTGTSEVPGQNCINVDAHVSTTSAYLIDTVKFAQRWSAVAAVRLDHITSSYFEQSPDTALEYEDGPTTLYWTSDNTLPSFRAAVVFQPQESTSIYLSTSTSVHPNVAQLAISSETPLTPPPDWSMQAIGHSLEMELGTKMLLADNRMTLTAALFWDTLHNAYGVDVDDPLNFVTGSRERVVGAEFGFAGHITSAWNVLLNYTFQDSQVTASSDPTLIGHQLLNAPKSSTSLWTTYDLTQQWQIGVGANEMSTRTAAESADPENGLIQEAPGYVIGSAMTKYTFNGHLSAQLNVTNITNRYYYDGVHPGHVVPGAGRTVYAGINWTL